MLDKVIKLLAYLNDKDLFAEFYRKRLSRRLLQDKIVEHHEMQVLAQLKAQCGAQFTGKVSTWAESLSSHVVHLTSRSQPQQSRCPVALPILIPRSRTKLSLRHIGASAQPNTHTWGADQESGWRCMRRGQSFVL